MGITQLFYKISCVENTVVSVFRVLGDLVGISKLFYKISCVENTAVSVFRVLGDSMSISKLYVYYLYCNALCEAFICIANKQASYGYA